MTVPLAEPKTKVPAVQKMRVLWAEPRTKVTAAQKRMVLLAETKMTMPVQEMPAPENSNDK